MRDDEILLFSNHPVGAVCVPVKGGFFPDQDDPAITPRLHLEIRFFADPHYSQPLAGFTTEDTTFLPYVRLLTKNIDRPYPQPPAPFSGSFPPEGLHAWWEYENNPFSVPELRPKGEMGSQVLVMVQDLVEAGLLARVPLTWAARFVNLPRAEAGFITTPVTDYSDWDFGGISFAPRGGQA